MWSSEVVGPLKKELFAASLSNIILVLKQIKKMIIITIAYKKRNSLKMHPFKELSLFDVYTLEICGIIDIMKIKALNIVR